MFIPGSDCIAIPRLHQAILTALYRDAAIGRPSYWGTPTVYSLGPRLKYAVERTSCIYMVSLGYRHRSRSCYHPTNVVQEFSLLQPLVRPIQLGSVHEPPCNTHLCVGPQFILVFRQVCCVSFRALVPIRLSDSIFISCLVLFFFSVAVLASISASFCCALGLFPGVPVRKHKYTFFAD